MSVISFNCPGCGQPIEAPADMAGQPAQCPSCAQEITIPAEAPAPSSGSATCPSCGADMDEGSVLCIACGFHIGLGKKIDTQI